MSVHSQTLPRPPPKKNQQSVEQHLALLIEDLLKYGSQATVTAAEALVLREAFMGLHYVWRMRWVWMDGWEGWDASAQFDLPELPTHPHIHVYTHTYTASTASSPR